MPNQLALAGSQSLKQKARKYAPLWVNRFVSGYWPNRNPLRDASLPVLEEKFYGALNDALIDGLNCEINTRSELTRRFGNSVLNSNAAGLQQRFYSFLVYGNNSLASYQRVLSSSATQITDITNNGDSLVYLKLTGAQKTTFQAIGDTTFFADTIKLQQLLSFVNSWTSTTSYSYGTNIVDSNNNVQKNLGGSLDITNIAVVVSNGVATLTANFNSTTLVIPVNTSLTFLGLTNALFLNNQNINVSSYSNSGTLTAIVNFLSYSSTSDTGIAYSTLTNNFQLSISTVAVSSHTLTVIIEGHVSKTGSLPSVGTTLTFNGLISLVLEFLNGTTFTISSINTSLNRITIMGAYITGNISTTSATGGYISWTGVNGTTGGSQLTWSTSYQGITIDGTTAWLFNGLAVRNVGITGPTTAPIVTNTLSTSLYNAWVANTYFFPGQIAYDSVSVSLQQLTTGGTTGASVLTFSATAGVTTTDGTATWTSLGLAARNTSTAYSLGSFIMATWNKYIIVVGPQHTPITITILYSAFYQCTVAGTSSATATSSISWPLSGSLVDGQTLTWTFVGLRVNRTSSATASLSITSTTFSPGNISNSQLIGVGGSLLSLNSASSPVSDGTNYELVVLAGKSGSTALTWSTTVGGSTTDGGVSWINDGLSGIVANTGNWFYAYAFLSSSTPDVSSASLISALIIRAVNSWISISGACSTDLQVDTIRIYRSLQQVTSVITVPGNELFWIADIPMPNSLTWDYVDTSNDLLNANSTMNTFIIADTTGINTPPNTSITNLAYYLGRLWGSVGNTLYASAGLDVVNGGNLFTAFPLINFMTFPSTIVRLYLSSQGLLVFLANGTQIVTGNGISTTVGGSGFTTFALVSYADNISLGGYDCLAVDGATYYIYTVDRNIVSLSSSGLSWISTAISNKLKTSFILPDGTSVNFTPSNSYLSWYVNGDDYGLFISDGSTGWFRMMLSTSPDAGNMVWSPFAEIAGGVSAVQSIETTIGIHNLIMGLGTSGLILYRDFTNSSDNTSTFPWFATFGSIVLAHLGEIAMVQSIVIDSVQIGSHLSITLWFNEINSTGVDYRYTDYKYDPYGGQESTTTYADRFYVSDDPDSCQICRHLQLAINFLAENVLNTVLSTTIIGAQEYDN